MTEFWSRVVQAVLLALIPILIPILISWLKLQAERIRNAKPDLYSVLMEGARIAVIAAEQAGVAQLISDKKQYAVTALQGYLNSHGWNGIDLAVIEAAIEAEVHEIDFPHATK